MGQSVPSYFAMESDEEKSFKEDVKAKEEISEEIKEEDGRIVIPRDYSRVGTIPRFLEVYPEVVARRDISKENYLKTIRTLNDFFEDAETLNCTTFLEGLFGCLTFFSIFLCYENNYKKILRELEVFLRKENEKYYNPKGLHIINPLYNGLLQVNLSLNSKCSWRSNSSINLRDEM